ncbi:MAG: hypothetical protein RLN69_07240, partial [Woeseiaceae bacterium]
NDFAVEMDLVRTLPHALSEEEPTVTKPVHFSAKPIEYRNAAPLLGEHTEEVLMQRMGYSTADIEKLRERGVI